MAVTSINGTPITSSNAKDIYWDICHNKYEGITKDSPEAKACKNKMSKDEIEYCENGESDAYDEGADKIDQADKTNKYGLSTTNKGCAVAGVSAAGLGAVLGALTPIFYADLTGIVPTVAAAVALLCSVVSIGAALGLDPAKSNRQAQMDNDQTNKTAIEEQTAAAETLVDEIDGAKDAYQAAQDEKTAQFGEHEASVASTQIELDTAISMGDTEKAQELQKQLDESQEFEATDADDAMAAQKEKMQEATVKNSELQGTSDAGRSVADFLLEAKPFRNWAWADAAACTAASVACGIAGVHSIASIPGLAWVPVWGQVQTVAKTAASIMFAIACAGFLAGAAINFNNVSTESKFIDGGDKTNEACDGLDEGIANVGAKIGETEGSFSDSDGNAAETKVGMSEAADGAVDENKDKPREPEPVV